MSQDAGTLTVTIALMGADDFDSSTQQITGDLNQIQSAAEEASGSSGLSGFSDAATSAGSSTSGLQSSTGTLSTAIGALGGSLSATVGGVLNMQESQTQLEQAHNRVERATTAVEKATNTYESTLAKYGGTANTASASTKSLASAQDALSAANEKVLKDEDTIAKDEENISKLRAEGKTNTTEYSDAVRKLQTDQGQLTIDQGKAKDAQTALNTAHTDFNDKAAPAVGLGAQKIQAAYDHLKDAQNTLTIAQKQLSEDTTRQWLSMAQTILGAVGSISAGIGTFGRLFSETKKTTDEFGNSATTVGTNWGKLIGTGGVLAGVGIALYAIANNIGGVRTGLEQWWSSISAGNPILTGFGELIHGIAADLGLTGTGVMSGQDEITKAIYDIHNALQQTDIGKDLENLSAKFQAFIKDPFGSTSTPIYGITQKPDTFFAPGSGKQITSLGPNAAVIGQQQTSNAQQLGEAILKTIEDGFNYVLTNIGPFLATYKTRFNQVTDTVFVPAGDSIGAALINGIDQALTGKTGTATPAQKQAGQNIVGKITDAASQAQGTPFAGPIDVIVTTAIKQLQNSPQIAAAAKALGANIVTQLASGFVWTVKEVTAIFSPLFDAKNWTQLFKDAGTVISKSFTFATNQVYDTFKPLFQISNWTQLFKDAGAVLSKSFTFATSQIYDTFKPLFQVSNWTQLFKDAQATLGQALSLAANQVYDTFKPLFQASNWTQLFKDAQATLSKAFSLVTNQIYDTFKPLFQLSNWTALIKDAQAAIMKALTPTQIYDTLKPLFQISNWSQLGKDAQDALVSAMKITGGALGSFGKIFAPLFDANNWLTIGSKIGDALANTLIGGVNAAITIINETVIAGLQKIPVFGANIKPIPTLGPIGQTTGTTTSATIPTGAVTVNSASTLGSGQITVNLVVSGQRLAQAMLPFQSGTSAFS